MNLEKIIRTIIIGLILIIVQLSLIRYISIFGAIPDLLLIFLFYISINYGPIPGTISGFFLGFFQDLMFPPYLGLNALSKTLFGYILGKMGKIFYETILLQIIGIFLTQFLNELLISMLRNFESVDGFFHFFLVAFRNSTYTAIISPLLFFIFNKLSISKENE